MVYTEVNCNFWVPWNISNQIHRIFCPKLLYFFEKMHKVLKIRPKGAVPLNFINVSRSNIQKVCMKHFCDIVQGSSLWKATLHHSSLLCHIFSEVTNCSEHAKLGVTPSLTWTCQSQEWFIDYFITLFPFIMLKHHFDVIIFVYFSNKMFS